MEECGLLACAQGHLPKETAPLTARCTLLLLEQSKKGSWEENSERL